MSKLVVVDSAGATHVFESITDPFITCDEWIKNNKSQEDFDHWLENSNLEAKTDKAVALYSEWLLANKVVHTISYPDGSELINDHATIEQ